MSDVSKPTTWIELFALFRLWGGHDQEEGPHTKKPRLAALLKAFVQQSKRLLRTCGNGESELLTGGYRGKTCLLASFGLCMHVPAIKAEICLTTEVGEQLNQMLINIRIIKQGPNSGKLKASAAPLPRLEPWRAIISHASRPIPLILSNRNIKENENITGRGENGLGRDLKPQVFNLSCPRCKHVKNCARNKLFTTAPVSLSCNNCRANTTSTQWQCSHGKKWATCHVHREGGMRCGRLGSQGLRNKRPDPSKVESRLFYKAKRLGALGSDHAFFTNPTRISASASFMSKQPNTCNPNSTRSPGNN